MGFDDLKLLGRNASWEEKLPWTLLSFVMKMAVCDSQETLAWLLAAQKG